MHIIINTTNRLNIKLCVTKKSVKGVHLLSGLTLPPPKHEHGFGEATVTEQKQLSVLQGNSINIVLFICLCTRDNLQWDQLKISHKLQNKSFLFPIDCKLVSCHFALVLLHIPLD